MSDFIKDKISVDIQKGMENEFEIMPRRYTLTHSDETGDLFLYIGEDYAINRIDEARDEVLAEWNKVVDVNILRVDVHLDASEKTKGLEDRDIIFRKELPLALKAIVYGDKKLYMNRKELINSPVIVYFNSNNEKYNKVERWGCIRDYIIGESRTSGEERILAPIIKDKVIITLLTPYIEKELKKLYGNKYVFCSGFSDIISINPLSPPLACKGSYIVVVGIRAGINPIRPNINNVIIEFIVKPEEVKVKSVKNPR